MAIELVPLSLPASADPSKLAGFGREVKGVNPGTLSPEEFNDVRDALHKVCVPAHYPLSLHRASSIKFVV